jgi:ABC-type dipeptide/oligopeptide/nickel transport system permease subunit
MAQIFDAQRTEELLLGPNAQVPVPESDQGPRSPTLVRAFLRRKGAVISLVILLVFSLAAIFAPWIAPHGPDTQNPVFQLLPPFWMHGGSTSYPLGTDELGRDILSRLIYGARSALSLAFAAASISAVVGTALGLVAGMSRRVAGAIIMWLCDSQLAFPYIVLALVVITARGSSFGSLLFVLSVFGWVQFARVVRASVMSVRQTDYVLSARGTGGSTLSLVGKHILPNVISPVIVLWTFSIAGVLLLESGLSFLGVGVQPPTPDWGQMFASGRAYVLEDWWYCFWPGLAIAVTVACANVLGRTLRVVLNPRSR